MVLVDTIKHSKDQALVTGDSNVNSKEKKNNKNPPYKKGDNSKSQQESSNSKKKNFQKKNFQKKKFKGEGRKCAYCGKGFHPESSCMKK